ncbi:hypothetical protein L2E82_05703 [Cichorium intybus]|uniref:Uncharacterized protein n=1 Tax=Cichorium intybus TaxID=13427 RepID=A0ACB9H9J5_CICIN|nr:hypothetical protein L2E82_05703 [Cichorium intybus]
MIGGMTSNFRKEGNDSDGFQARWLRAPCGPIESSELIQLNQIVANVSISQAPDKWFCRISSNEVFSVECLRRAIEAANTASAGRPKLQDSFKMIHRSPYGLGTDPHLFGPARQCEYEISKAGPSWITITSR